MFFQSSQNVNQTVCDGGFTSVLKGLEVLFFYRLCPCFTHHLIVIGYPFNLHPVEDIGWFSFKPVSFFIHIVLVFWVNRYEEVVLFPQPCHSQGVRDLAGGAINVLHESVSFNRFISFCEQ